VVLVLRQLLQHELVHGLLVFELRLEAGQPQLPEVDGLGFLGHGHLPGKCGELLPEQLEALEQVDREGAPGGGLCFVEPGAVELERVGGALEVEQAGGDEVSDADAVLAAFFVEVADGQVEREGVVFAVGVVDEDEVDAVRELLGDDLVDDRGVGQRQQQVVVAREVLDQLVVD
jgi:hypothetical protein